MSVQHDDYETIHAPDQRQEGTMKKMKYVADSSRHLVCVPYSIENLHKMAEDLGIHRRWFHGGRRPHYDIPKRRIAEILGKVDEIVSSREIVGIIVGTRTRT